MNKRVLVVDDEPDMTLMVKLGLEGYGGYDVREENDSASVMKVVREFRPDVIVLDIMMPGADGGEVATSLLRDPELKHIPVLFLTALVSRTESCEPHSGFGRRHYLAKPLNLSELVRYIEQAITATPPATPERMVPS
jgi:CheY-like chemotaxis protein